ncbi:MAG: response regulator transcription factor [Gammaproteobacteria bacterium]
MQDAAPTLLLADDDETFCSVLGEALKKRGFSVRIAHSVDEALDLARHYPPSHAVVDLRMPAPSGLELVARLCERYPAVRLVVLTGFASITTAIEAIKLGATYYLTKPTDADEVVAAFERDAGTAAVETVTDPISIDRIEWEHIQRVMVECNGNVSMAARRLDMHRRTLQRKLQKRPPPV